MRSEFIIPLVFIFILSSFLANAQNGTDANIFGDVKCNGKHVPYINVLVKGTTIGTNTDGTGHYMLINLPVGKHIIRVQGIGYKPQEKEVEVMANKSIELNFDVEEDILLMEQVVVTADRNEENRKEASIVVDVITPKVFESKQSVCLIDGLNFAPGLRTETNCQNCGFTQVRMNGMAGPYSQILINSRPVFSGLAGVYSLELLPANMIQRIEVVRGGGSVLYGGNAIAGTINIITTEPFRNSFDIGSNFSAIGIGNKEGGEIAWDKSLVFNGSLVSSDYKSGISLYGMVRNRDPYDANNDGFSEMVKIKNRSIGFNAFYKTGQLSKISLDFYNINEFRRGGNKFNMLPHEADICEQLDHDITGASLTLNAFTRNSNKFSVYVAAQNIDRDSYYGASQDPNGYGKTDDFTYNLGTLYAHNFKKVLFSPSVLTLGIENTNTSLKDEKLGTQGDLNTLIADQRSNTIGSYVQNEWNTGRFKFLLGFRFDHYDIIDKSNDHEAVSGNVLIPRASFLYNINEDLQYRLSYAKGYRAPQIFDEDLHIETSGARRVTHRNDPGLKQETSHSVSTSFNFSKAMNKVLYEFLIEGFYTKLLDPFVNIYSPADSLGNVEYLRTNATDGARVTGVNLELNLATMKNLSFQLGMTIQISEYDKPQPWGEDETQLTRSFLRTPNTYGYLMFNWKPFRHFSTAITGTYTGRMYVPHFGLDPETTDPNEQEAIQNGDVIIGERLEYSDPFFDMGIVFTYEVDLSKKISLQVQAGIQNIFNSIQNDYDVGIYRDPGYIYGPSQPRTISFGLKIGNVL